MNSSILFNLFVFFFFFKQKTAYEMRISDLSSDVCSSDLTKAENLSNKIDIIKDRIGSELQFYNYYFTHHTNLLTTEEKRSAYSRLTTMNEKLDMQISTAKLINTVKIGRASCRERVCQ